LIYYQQFTNFPVILHDRSTVCIDSGSNWKLMG